ncbi:hypothetical protein [Brevibacterium jeotgali]|uniref:Uncharacterized protein n=1 Tax=Brevibacterium jeotgali TaxID=1262550 RepID=A0A2H1L8L6_9MICO|nr:hypothetical protein [Brevibacterium jeotgali]TWC02751.1 hypothetical protein FB108_1442 [Brevibacterium jeotgali]SMY13135.1 hypothetical protein BJEO58_02745 [Brevibacterium jeotgali]
MDAGAAGESRSGGWTVEEQIDPTLFRVRRNGQTRWFAVVESDAVGESESRVWTHVRGACVEGRGGLLVARCEGGLLEGALRRRGGMSAALALGVLDEVLELLETAPVAPRGVSRAAIRSFAVERGGGVALIPGRFREGAKRSDAAELGELLHLSLTGSTWEETALPLAETAPDVPTAVSALVSDLLEGEILTRSGERVDFVDLRARIARLGPSRARGFLPAEPGVLEEDVPTGTLSPEVVVALRGAPLDGRQPSGPSRVPAENRGIATTRRDRRRVERGGRHGRLSIGILAGCAAAVAAGAVLMGSGAGTGDADVRHEASRRAPAAPPDPTPAPMSPRSLSPSTVAQSSQGPTRMPATSEPHASEPRDAAVELTRARAEAFAVGDADALAAVTVPGSPAAEADAQRTLGECAECADALSLSDVGFADEHEVPAVRGEQHDEEGRTPAEGKRAHVSAMMRSAGAAPVPVVFVLEWYEGRWRVHDVHPS